MNNLLVKISIILIGIINVVFIKYYKEKKKSKIEEKLKNIEDVIDEEDYTYLKYEEKNSFMNEFILISTYVVFYLVFSYTNFESLTQTIMIIITNYMLVFILNVSFFKSQIKKEIEYKMANEKYIKENKIENDKNDVSSIYEKIFDKKNELSVEMFLFENRKKSIENIIINYVFIITVIIYFIITALYYLIF